MSEDILTKKGLIDRIPRTSAGRIKGSKDSEGYRLARLLGSYAYSQTELRLIEAEIVALGNYYGHEGAFVLKKNRSKPIFHAIQS